MWTNPMRATPFASATRIGEPCRSALGLSIDAGRSGSRWIPSVEFYESIFESPIGAYTSIMPWKNPYIVRVYVISLK